MHNTPMAPEFDASIIAAALRIREQLQISTYVPDEVLEEMLKMYVLNGLDLGIYDAHEDVQSAYTRFAVKSMKDLEAVYAPQTQYVRIKPTKWRQMRDWVEIVFSALALAAFIGAVVIGCIAYGS